jgi:hypothetical protein
LHVLVLVCDTAALDDATMDRRDNFDETFRVRFGDDPVEMAWKTGSLINPTLRLMNLYLVETSFKTLTGGIFSSQ